MIVNAKEAKEQSNINIYKNIGDDEKKEVARQLQVIELSILKAIEEGALQCEWDSKSILENCGSIYHVYTTIVEHLRSLGYSLNQFGESAFIQQKETIHWS